MVVFYENDNEKQCKWKTQAMSRLSGSWSQSSSSPNGPLENTVEGKRDMRNSQFLVMTCQQGKLGWGICPLKTLLSDYVEGNVVRYNFKFKHMLAVPKPSTQRQLDYLCAHGWQIFEKPEVKNRKRNRNKSTGLWPPVAILENRIKDCNPIPTFWGGGHWCKMNSESRALWGQCWRHPSYRAVSQGTTTCRHTPQRKKAPWICAAYRFPVKVRGPRSPPSVSAPNQFTIPGSIFTSLRVVMKSATLLWTRKCLRCLKKKKKVTPSPNSIHVPKKN